MVNWGTNQYGQSSWILRVMNGTVFQKIADAHLKIVSTWQWLFSDDQILSISNLCKSTDPPLQLWVNLEYNVPEAVDLVTKLGDDCHYYEVCKEPQSNYTCGLAWATTTPAVYAQRWRDVVTACREVTDDLPGTYWYGGPVSGRAAYRHAYYETWLDVNSDILDPSDSFISYHWYTHYPGYSLPSKSTLISTATSQIVEDVTLFNSYCNSYLGAELPIALTEFNWTAADPVTPDYSVTDEAFMQDWTNAAMQACIDNDVWTALFWNFGGYWENAMAIIQNFPNYEPKYQYYAIQDFLEGSSQKTFSAGGSLAYASANLPFSVGGGLFAEGIKQYTVGGVLEYEAEVNPVQPFSAGGILEAFNIIPFSAGGILDRGGEKSFTVGGTLEETDPTVTVVVNSFTDTLTRLERQKASWYLWSRGMWKPGMWEQDNIMRRVIHETEKVNMTGKFNETVSKLEKKKA